MRHDRPPYYFIMKGKHLMPTDMITAGEYMQTANRSVGLATLLDMTVQVSTVFLCINHYTPWSKKPVLFETMIFGGANDGYTQRYSSYREAKKGHVEAIKLALLNQ